MLPRICEELSTAGEAGWALARWLAVRQWKWIENEMGEADNDPSPSTASARLSALVPPLLAILRSTVVIGAFDVQESIVRERRVFEWPLAKEHRAHVHQIIERHELPVAHQTRRAGRPYTLVLTKREALSEREAARRKQWLEDLE